MKILAGQVSILTAVGIGTTIVIALVGGFIAQSNLTESRIDEVKRDNIATVQRIASLEANSNTMKEDIREIKMDLKAILKILK